MSFYKRFLILNIDRELPHDTFSICGERVEKRREMGNRGKFDDRLLFVAFS